ncbi:MULTISPECIES: 50S ribosomal protein L10 [Candidatus Nitrosocaldus]|jgi:large subunit ribosomal protein L10|uniref:Large ribosomal subunit protein uL10 n=1 Tax=Candidatus Nitrosocaldus cavascurensis TaxID=2058097 RepID=A0A2K5AST1_9ARCH|nr:MULTISPECIES: 50S ribosomal protein L10 [Candidatus Nitrosocaldus]SPC34706.1 Acidic ribosomal protein P0 (L10p) [Candidatus Nitrosocaldus cavascurensis]
MIQQQQQAKVYPEKKVRMYRMLQEEASRYRAIALVKMDKVRSTQLMPLRKILADEAKMIMVKNRLAVKALSGSGVKGIEKILKEMEGQNLLIFTNMNPFKLQMLLEKNKVYLPAKGGDVATEDIVVPAGNTGLAPGPILSEFREAKIQTKIEEGTVWIAKDTVVAKAGEVISMKLASLLSKLGIKPIKAGVNLHMVLEDGLVYRSEDLKLDVEAYRKSIEEAYSNALTLAVNAAYPTKESIAMIVSRAYSNALTLAVNAAYPAREVIRELLMLAEAHAQTIARQANIQ